MYMIWVLWLELITFALVWSKIMLHMVYVIIGKGLFTCLWFQKIKRVMLDNLFPFFLTWKGLILMPCYDDIDLCKKKEANWYNPYTYFDASCVFFIIPWSKKCLAFFILLTYCYLLLKDLLLDICSPEATKSS